MPSLAHSLACLTLVSAFALAAPIASAVEASSADDDAIARKMHRSAIAIPLWPL